MIKLLLISTITLQIDTATVDSNWYVNDMNDSIYIEQNNTNTMMRQLKIKLKALEEKLKKDPK